MHVLIAPRAFSGSLTAGQAAAAMASGWSRGAPHDVVTAVPLSDGGTGFVDAVAASLPGTVDACVTTDPLGRSVPAAILVAHGEGRRVAYVEAAQSVGLHLLADPERDPRLTTSFGLGTVLMAALDLGASTIVVGIGGSGTNDAGAGLLAALGVGSAEQLAAGGQALADVSDRDLQGLQQARDPFRGVDLVVASSVEAPLLGLKGTTAMYAVGKGATDTQAQALENALGHFVSVVSRVMPPATDLLSGIRLRPERDPGAGAGGGIGYALGLLGARRVPGVEAVLDAVGFASLLARADLVVTGQGCYDWESLRGSVVAAVAHAAANVGTPTVVIAGQALVGRRESMATGLSGVYAVAERRAQVAAALSDPVATLSARTARVARTWSPPRR